MTPIAASEALCSSPSMWFARVLTPTAASAQRRTGARALAFALALSGLADAALATGLGAIVLRSGLGEPLRAEIQLIAPPGAKLEGLSARLADAASFRRAGLEMVDGLGGAKLAAETRGSAPAVVRLSTTAAINEPVLDLLVELDWAGARVQRGYTVMLEPPGRASAGKSGAGAGPVKTASVTVPAIVVSELAGERLAGPQDALPTPRASQGASAVPTGKVSPEQGAGGLPASQSSAGGDVGPGGSVEPRTVDAAPQGAKPAQTPGVSPAPVGPDAKALQRALLRRDQELATMRSELERLRQTSAPTLSERAESAQSAPAPATPATPATQSVPVENAVSATVSAAPGAAANTAALESQSEQPWALFEPSPLAWLGLALLIGGAVLIGIKRRRASLLAAQAPSRKDLEASESALVEGVVLNHLPDLSDFSGLGLNAPSKSGAGSGPSQIAKAPP